MRYIHLINKYKFLFGELVSRDFKAKYKRSFLGILWSLLNPLLIMTVQYFVFSTIFRTDISNFGIYLMTGNVMFAFFSESTTSAKQGITGSAGLITKVYMPKYIFPISKTISVSINLLFSIAALYIMIFFTGIPITSSHFAMPLALVYIVLFSVGVGMILSSLIVFFRDVQFLYSIFITILMYLTPIFYPETLLEGKLFDIYKLNPLFHFIRYLRTIVLQGILPSFKANVFCITFVAISLLVGFIVFKKAQNKFILYL